MERLLFFIFSDPIVFFVSLLGFALVFAIIFKAIESAFFLKSCPKCAENVKVAATMCKHCGSPLT